MLSIRWYFEGTADDVGNSVLSGIGRLCDKVSTQSFNGVCVCVRVCVCVCVCVCAYAYPYINYILLNMDHLRI